MARRRDEGQAEGQAEGHVRGQAGGHAKGQAELKSRYAGMPALRGNVRTTRPSMGSRTGPSLAA